MRSFLFLFLLISQVLGFGVNPRSARANPQLQCKNLFGEYLMVEGPLLERLRAMMMSSSRNRGKESSYVDIQTFMSRFDIVPTDNVVALVLKLEMKSPADMIEILPLLESLSDKYKVGFNKNVVGISSNGKRLEVALVGYHNQVLALMDALEGREFPTAYELLSLGKAHSNKSDNIVIGEKLVNISSESEPYKKGFEAVKNIVAEGKATFVTQLGLSDKTKGYFPSLAALPFQKVYGETPGLQLKSVSEKDFLANWESYFIDVVAGKYALKVYTPAKLEIFIVDNSKELAKVVNHLSMDLSRPSNYQNKVSREFINDLIGCLFCDVKLVKERESKEESSVVGIVRSMNEERERRRTQKSPLDQEIVDKIIYAADINKGARRALRDRFPLEMYTMRPRFIEALLEILEAMRVSNKDQAEVLGVLKHWEFNEREDIRAWGKTTDASVSKSYTKDLMLRILQLVAQIYNRQFPNSETSINPDKIHTYEEMSKLLEVLGFPQVYDGRKKIFLNSLSRLLEEGLLVPISEPNFEKPQQQVSETQNKATNEIKESPEEKSKESNVFIDDQLRLMAKIFIDTGGSGRYITNFINSSKQVSKKSINRFVNLLTGKITAYLTSKARDRSDPTAYDYISGELKALREMLDEIGIPKGTPEEVIREDRIREVLALIEAIEIISEFWWEHKHPNRPYPYRNIHLQNEFSEIVVEILGSSN